MRRILYLFAIVLVAIASLFGVVATLQAGPAVLEAASSPALVESSDQLVVAAPVKYGLASPVPGVPLSGFVDSQGGAFRQKMAGRPPQLFPPVELFARVQGSYDFIDGQFFSETTTVYFTVTDSIDGVKSTGSSSTFPDGWMNGVGLDTDVVPGDFIYFTTDHTFSGTMEMITIDGVFSSASDKITGTMSGGVFPVWGNMEVHGSGDYGQPISITASGDFAEDLGGFYDIQSGDEVWVWYPDPNGNQLGASLFEPSLNVRANYAHEWVDGNTMPGTAVTITLSDGGGTIDTAVAIADSGGYFSTDCGSWNSGNCPDIAPGQTVVAEAPSLGLVATIDPIGEVTGVINEVTDVITGTLNASWFVTAPVGCEIWEPGGWGIYTTTNGDNGEFTCDFTGHWDIQPGDQIAVRYEDEEGDSVINILGWPWMRVNYDHEWAGGDYAAGHTFWITVTDAVDVVKATTMADSQPGQGWQGDGFDTGQNPWVPSHPDIMPGDKVYFRADDGYMNMLNVGTVNGVVNVATDQVTGTVDAPDFGSTVLDVECHPWGAPGPTDIRNSFAAADGSGPPFDCDWSGEWDIVPGQEAAAMYVEPDLDRVIGVFLEPAPYLRINKWADGDPAEDGNFVFHVEFWNDGGAPAEDVVITDTLDGFSYLVDTNLYSVMTGTIPGGEYVVWDVGTLEPGSYEQFDLFVKVEFVAGDPYKNKVQITTSNPYDQGEPEEKYALWSGEVAPNDTYLSVDKYAWTGDPAPDTDFVFAVNTCSQGSTASSSVVMTDTLHPSLTLKSWWSQHPGWYELSSDPQALVVSYPSAPAGWCGEVYLKVHLDAAAMPGEPLTNTAEIFAENNLDPENNIAFWEGQVGEPYTNLAIDKSFGWGVLVPGGQIGYNLDSRNSGNLPVSNTIYITDYLSTNTSFNAAFWHDQYGPHPVTPTVLTADYVVWEIPNLPNGYGHNWEVILDIDPAAPVGAILYNEAAISPQPDEANYEDNVSFHVDEVFAPGPRLRINKYGWWPNTGQLGYWLALQNIGDQEVLNVTVTDTYPLSTTFNGDWWHNFWEGVNLVEDPANRRLVWTVDRLEPGWSTGIGLRVDLDGNIIGQGGLVFTNTAQIGDPGSVWDEASVTQWSGPDLWIEKFSQPDVHPVPGNFVTYTIRFGNDNQQPWVAGPTTHITDTIPAGMIFYTATAPNSPNDPWMPMILPGGELAWEFGEIQPFEIWEFSLVLEVPAGIDPGPAQNVIELYSDNPEDVEVDFTNNTDDDWVDVRTPIYVISKDHDSSAIAGLPVTYTLTFSNIGNYTGTGLFVTDLVPADVTYVSGGNYDPGTGIVSWDWPLLDIDEVGQVTFVGELACSGQALNDDYLVAASDQGGLGSPPGPPVVFNILAPTINASFVQSVDVIYPGQTVVFTSTSTTNGTQLIGWIWDFGDGQTGSGEVVSHTYEALGSYAVSLTVDDACLYSENVVMPSAVTVEPFTGYLPVVLNRPLD